jgi:hypothetical protein
MVIIPGLGCMNTGLGLDINGLIFERREQLVINPCLYLVHQACVVGPHEGMNNVVYPP